MDMMKLDFAKLRQELLRAVRGKMPTRRLSTATGFDYDKVARWEAGTVRVYWDDFVSLCLARQLEPKQALNHAVRYTGDPRRFDLVIAFLVDDGSLSKTAVALGVSRHRLGRWRQRQSQPLLEDVLRLIHICRARLTDFVDTLVGIDKVPSLRPIHKTVAAQRRLYWEMPQVAAVLRAVELARHQLQHSQNLAMLDFVAQKCALAPPLAKKILDLLERHGLIARQGKELSPTSSTSRLDTSLGYSEFRKLFAHFLRQALTLLEDHETIPKGTYLGYRIYACSEKTRIEIRNKLIKINTDIVQLLDQDKGKKDMIQVAVVLAYDPQFGRTQ